MEIQEEHGSFYDYIKTFTNGEIFHERGLTEKEEEEALEKAFREKQV